VPVSTILSKEKSLPPPGIEPRFFGCPALSLFTILSELSCFQRQKRQQNNKDLEDTLGLFMMEIFTGTFQYYVKKVDISHLAEIQL